MSADEDEARYDADEKHGHDLTDKRKLRGQLKLPGDAFDECASGEVVSITGQVVFISPVLVTPKCRFEITGQVVAPESAERVLIPAIMNMTGQMILYPDGVKPRTVLGKETFSQAFFEAMTERELLINLGEVCFTPEVEAESVKEKIHSIINLGRIECGKSLRPIVQVLCRDNLGKIEDG